MENTALNVKNVAKSKGEIKGVETLDRLASLFGIEETDLHKKAEAVADAVLRDLYLPEYEKVSISHKNCRQQRRSGRSRACLVAAVFAYRRVLVELPGK